MKKAWVLSYPLSAQLRLIRLGRCPGWSDIDQAGCTLILLVLSCPSSNVTFCNSRSVGRVSAPGMGCHRFDLGPRHTKVVKNGSSCSSLSTQTYEVVMELGLVWYQVSLHDTSVQQHCKSAHWAPCRNQTPLWYGWKIVEGNIKPEQTTITTVILIFYTVTKHYVLFYITEQGSHDNVLVNSIP